MSGTTPPVPDITTPLVRDGKGQDIPAQAAGLGALVGLVGNWNSPPGAAATGFNVMPVPAGSAPDGYELFNATYFEQMTISALPGTAANRASTFQQVGFPLFYEQRVYFADTAAENTLIHAENGSWLHLQYQSESGEPPNTQMQPAATAYVKQVSVPHGNDVLATGSTKGPYDGPPTDYPKADDTVLPFSDPSKKVVDPNTYLQRQIDELAANGVTVQQTTEINVSSANPGGAMTNIEFEQRNAKVTKFSSVFYIQELSNGTTQLQYSQSMWLDLLINGTVGKFVHIDANTLVSA